jgi:SAM-dependent methyltransferase
LRGFIILGKKETLNMDNAALKQNEKYFHSDAHFNQLYPHEAQLMAAQHFTPLHVTRHVIDFLAAEHGARILDIGSGAGKFCLVAAAYAPPAFIFGVEQRVNLVAHALNAKKQLGLDNVSFIEGNFIQLDLRQYDHFYFYNSFYENLNNFDRIDETIVYSEELYASYVRSLHHQLKLMPKGTKIATYHSFTAEIPKEYKLVETTENGELKFWVRK